VANGLANLVYADVDVSATEGRYRCEWLVALACCWAGGKVASGALVIPRVRWNLHVIARSSEYLFVRWMWDCIPGVSTTLVPEFA